MKLRDYLTRKSGFGRTGWTEFTVIASAILLMAGYAVIGPEDEVAARWFVGGMALMVSAVMIGGTINNYRRDNKKTNT